METKSGQIINVTQKTISPPGKRPFTVHAVVLGSGEEIEVGFKQPYKIGQQFNSEVEFKFGKYKETKALGGAPSGASASVPASPTAGMAFPIAKTNKETAIIRQNALTNAVNTVNKFAEGQREAYKTLDGYVDEIIGVAYKFAEFSSGQREMRLAKDLVDGQD